MTVDEDFVQYKKRKKKKTKTKTKHCILVAAILFFIDRIIIA